MINLFHKIQKLRLKKLYQFFSNLLSDHNKSLDQKILELHTVFIGGTSLLIMYLLKPLIKVKIGYIRSIAFGHFVIEPELYLRMKESKQLDENCFVIFYFDDYICNQQIAKMWKRKVYVTPLARTIKKFMDFNFVPDMKEHVAHVRKYPIHNRKRLVEDEQRQFQFSAEERSKGWKQLEEAFGISKNTPYVTVHIRDSAWFKNHDNMDDENLYRNRHRNVDPNTLVPAIHELLDRGYHVIRLGKKIETFLDIEHQHYINFAEHYPSDFLDIFIQAHCTFFLGDTSGPINIPRIINKPLVLHNFVPLQSILSNEANLLFSFKKIYSHSKERLLTVREMVHGETGFYLHTRQFEENNLEVVANTPGEIRDLVVEMDERLNNRWNSSEKDEQLQQKFKSIFPTLSKYTYKDFWYNTYKAKRKPTPAPEEIDYELIQKTDRVVHYPFLARAGTKFLQDNKNLLA